jgi:hypothetical protein
VILLPTYFHQTYQNIYAGINKSSFALAPLFASAQNSGSNLTASTFNDSRSQLLKLGISLDDVVEAVNEYITEAQQLNNTDIIRAGDLQLEMVLIDYLLRVSI